MCKHGTTSLCLQLPLLHQILAGLRGLGIGHALLFFISKKLTPV